MEIIYLVGNVSLYIVVILPFPLSHFIEVVISPYNQTINFSSGDVHNNRINTKPTHERKEIELHTSTQYVLDTVWRIEYYV